MKTLNANSEWNGEVNIAQHMRFMLGTAKRQDEIIVGNTVILTISVARIQIFIAAVGK
jgi:hypothetical protein